jgi:hypothetical protein
MYFLRDINSMLEMGDWVFSSDDYKKKELIFVNK